MNAPRQVGFSPAKRVALIAFCSALVAICATIFFATEDSPPGDDGRIVRAGDNGVSRRSDRTDEVRSSMIRRVPDLFVPSIALKPQLPALRAAADKGDGRAACALSSALHICGSKKGKDRLLDYPDSYFSGMSEEESERAASRLILYEKRIESMCADMTEDDAFDADQRRLQAAIAGYGSAINGTVLLFGEPDEKAKAVADAIARRYKEVMEDRINRSAENGDVDAMASVVMSSSTGYLMTTQGEIQVKQDALKSLAAQSALAWIRMNADKERLPASQAIDDDTATQSSIDRLTSRMSHGDFVRFEKIKSKYIAAWREKSKRKKNPDSFFDAFPEKACAETVL